VLTGGATMSDNLGDPLLVLLRRHEQANAAYDTADNPSDAERAQLFAACTRTMQAIIDWAPAATTGEGAAAALEHVLSDEGLWHGRGQSEVFLRQLIEAARDYIVRVAG